MRLVYLTLGWLLGLVIASAVPVLGLRTWVGFFIAGLAIAWIVRHHPLRWWIFALVAMLAGGLRYNLLPQTDGVSAFNGKQVAVTGIVNSDPDIRDNSVQIRIQTEQLFDGSSTYETNGVVLAVLPRTTRLKYGDRVSVSGFMTVPGEFDAFSYADYLARQGIYSLIRSATLGRVELVTPNDFTSGLIAIRSRARELIASYLPEPQAGLLTGILLGDERGMSNGLSDDFGAVGASHIIAISGFNMTILSGVVVALMSRLKARQGFVVAFAIGVLIVYTVFVGATPSVLRAALMSSLLLIAPLLNRKTYLPATLAFAALMMTMFDPFALWDVGFQLSFVAVLGMALFVPPMQRLLDNVLLKRLPTDSVRTASGFVSDTLLVTLAAQLATTPLLALVFQRVSVVSLVTNALVIPVQPALLVLGVIALISAFVFPPIALVVFPFVLVLLAWTISIVRLFADLPFAQVSIQISPVWVGLLYLSVLGVAIMTATRPTSWIRFGQFVRSRPVMTAIVSGGTCVLALLMAVVFSRPDGKLHVWWLDVGHGNAVLMQTPNGATVLIDGGRYPTRLLTALGDRLPFYDRTIDLLVVTHPDDFDTTALIDVLARYEIGAAITNGQPNVSATQAEIVEALADTRMIVGEQGTTVEFSDGVSIEVLSPMKTPTIDTSLGDGALVLRVTYRERSFLLTSDVSREQQEILMSEVDLTSDVVQVPDHATARSLSNRLPNAVQPSLAIVAIDPANGRGDPNPDTLALLEAIPTLRTDQIGTIHLYTDGVKVWYLPEKI